jgi:release factor glutamine methyltransferase
VALALKDERPDLAVRGTDVDSGALTVARRNAVRLGLEVEFSRADLLGDGGAGGRGGAIGGAVLANLPYVPDGSSLAPEISLYEPAGALFAGSDGLSLVRRLVFAACAAAQPGIALLALEIGSEQAGAVVRLMGQAGYTAVEVRRDLAGYERVVVGRR